MEDKLFSKFYETLPHKANFAKACGCSHIHLWMVARGKRGMSVKMAKAIESASSGQLRAVDLLGLNKFAA